MITAFALAAGTGLLAGGAYGAEAGARSLDGTIEAGISPDTNRAVYTTSADAPGKYSFDHAQAYCRGLEANGHKDWRVPNPAELSVLFNNRAAIGGFEQSTAPRAGGVGQFDQSERTPGSFNRRIAPLIGWYWSS